VVVVGGTIGLLEGEAVPAALLGQRDQRKEWRGRGSGWGPPNHRMTTLRAEGSPKWLLFSIRPSVSVSAVCAGYFVMCVECCGRTRTAFTH
jgi:hypothetical protein